MNKSSKKVLNDSKAKLDEPATPIPSLLKTQSNEKNRSRPTLNRKMKNEKSKIKKSKNEKSKKS